MSASRLITVEVVKGHITFCYIMMPRRLSQPVVSSNASMGTLPDTLLMNCQVFVRAPDGCKVKAHALLDSTSSSSFISKRLVQTLGIP